MSLLRMANLQPLLKCQNFGSMIEHCGLAGTVLLCSVRVFTLET